MENCNEKRVLGAFVTGDPEFQTFHGILERLNQRGYIELRVFTSSNFLRKRPYCKQFYNEANLLPVIRLSRLYKLITRPWIKGLDALLVIDDPTKDTVKNPRLCKHLLAANLPTILFQHGVVQENITHKLSPLAEPVKLHSDLIFLFEELTNNRSIFSEHTISRICRSGFIKKLNFTPNSLRYAEILSEFDQRILFAHSFRSLDHYSNFEVSNYFQMVREFAIQHPKIAIILRPHRGKQKNSHKKFDNELRRMCSNVFLANQRSGLLRGALMNDLLAMSDILVTTPSTAILDAIYMNIPVAVTLNDSNKFMSLPQVNDFISLQRFLSNPNAFNNSYDEIRKHFGNLDDNIEKTCEKIEKFLSILPCSN